MSNRVMHFEILSNHPEASIRFFQEVFDWSIEQWGDEHYWLVKTGDEDKPGINGAITSSKDQTQAVVNTIAVTDLDTTVNNIEVAGGKIIQPRTAVPGIGWLVYFQDPDGNTHGVLQSDMTAK